MQFNETYWYETSNFAVYTYELEVYTGNLENAASGGSVCVMLVGNRGDTGHRKLLKSRTGSSQKFQLGQVIILRC